MHDPVTRTQAVKAEVCPYHCIIIPARNGNSNLIKGDSFQNNIAEFISISEWFKTIPYASTMGKNKATRSILKRTRLMANKIKQVVSGKEFGWPRGKKKFPQVFVENKGLEEICRRVFTGILDS